MYFYIRKAIIVSAEHERGWEGDEVSAGSWASQISPSAYSEMQMGSNLL